MAKGYHKIQVRLILIISGITFTAMCLLAFLTISQSIKVYKSASIEQVMSETQAIARLFEGKLNTISTKLNTFSQAPETSLSFPEEGRREVLNAFLIDYFEDGEDTLAFAQWMMVVPGVIDYPEYSGRNDAYDKWFRNSFTFWNGKKSFQGTDSLSYNPLDGANDNWFGNPYKSQKMIITEPYIWDYGGEQGELFVTSFCHAVTADGKSIGVGGYDLDLSYFQDALKDISPYPGSYNYMNTESGTVVAYEKEAWGKPLAEVLPLYENQTQQPGTILEAEGFWHVPVEVNIQYVESPWILTIAVPESEVMAPFRRMLYYVIPLIAVMLALMIVFVSLLASRIAKPIEEIASHADRLSHGDLDLTISFAGRTDEIGDTGHSLKNMVARLEDIVRSIQDTTDNVNAHSRQIADFSNQLSSGASEQAASSEEVSASMEEMAASIQNNTDNAAQTLTMARKNYQDVSEGGEAVRQTVEAMEQIAEKISVIDEISRQTNLLALNAAIEAARAGDAGKGFAVVASEVRKLAEHSQKAASEISELSQNSTRVAEIAGTKLAQVVPDIAQTTELIQEIASSSQEQSSGTSQINSALLQLDQTIQSSSSTAEEMNGIAEELRTQAEELTKQVRFFKLKEARALLTDETS